MAKKKDNTPKLWLIVILICISLMFWIATFTNFRLNGTTILLIVISLAVSGFTAMQITRYLEMISVKRTRDKKEKEFKEQRDVAQALIKQGIYPKYQNQNFNLNDIIVIDTETTGTNREKDEILQLAIIDGNGKELFNHLIRPVSRKTWTDAERINGISPDRVKNEKAITEYADDINIIFEGKTVVGYNVEFDIAFLNNANVFDDRVKEPIVCADLMIPFSVINGEYNARTGDYRWKKLTDCAKYYGYDGEGEAHDAMADCKATLYCFKKMCGM